MKYTNIVKAKFVSRPNRFVAIVDINGSDEVVHVKNTGRCKELLVEGCTVYLQKSDNSNRKTKYDLISVIKNGMLINMDSQAPNKVFDEWIKSGNFIKNISFIKPECKYKNSRFDFYIECEREKIFAEIKGVTLENDGVVSFPDAPTERGLKHILELCDCVDNGYSAYIFFIVQMDKCKYFTPNKEAQPMLAKALIDADKKGVKIIALTCDVSPDELKIKDFAEVRF